VPPASRAFLHIVILFLVAVIVTSSIWARQALLGGHSTKIDLARLVEFDAAIRAGDFFPTWSPDLYSGYGSPIFQFYAPLAYYAAEVPMLMGFDFATALKITQLLGLFASGLAMYRLASTYFSHWTACLGGVFYMVAPYRFVDIFVRHSLTEHFAFIWLPLIVWGTERIVSKCDRVGLATGALATAALIFTHNGMALIGLPVCVAAGWALAILLQNVHQSDRIGSWLRLGAAGAVAALGVGLATFFWWPAMSGLAFTRSEASLTGDYFDFHHHFVKGWQFLDPRWNFGVSAGDTGENAESSGGQMSLQIGLLHLLAGLGALAMVLFRWQGDGDAGRRRAAWSVLGVSVMAIGVFMSCRLSQLVWESLPFVKYVQFPWRFLGLVVFGAAICATALGDRFAAVLTGRNRTAIVFAIGLFIVMAAYFPYYSQARFLVRNANSLAFVSAAQLDALQSTGGLIPFGFSMSVAELRQNRESATSLDDFLPRDVKQKPTQPPAQMVEADGGRVVETAQLHQNHYRSRMQMSGAGKTDLLQFWFPGWQATVDGIQVETAPSGPQAVVSCDVPVGEHLVEFRYRGLPQRRTGIIVSIIAIAVGACALYFLRRPREATQFERLVRRLP